MDYSTSIPQVIKIFSSGNPNSSLYLYVTRETYLTMAKTTNIKETLIKAGKLLAWVIVIWFILMIAVQVALSSGVAEKLISKYAAEYIDGTTSLGKLNVSVFRHFPNISLSADDFNITYPADRFDSMESEGPQSPFSRKGQGTECDTLAAFDRLAVSIDVLSLARGKISIPYAELTAPRIYAHRYSNGQANWDILLPSSGDDPAIESDEETSGGIPEIKFGHIGMSSHPHIVYTDSKDTLFAVADLKQVRLSGRLTPGRNARNKLGIYLDSLFVAGRTSRDTLAFGMDHFSISENRRAFQINASANTMVASEMNGRIRIPIQIDGAFGFPRSKEPGLLSNMKAGIVGLVFKIGLRRSVRLSRFDAEAQKVARRYKAADDGYLFAFATRLDKQGQNYGKPLIKALLNYLDATGQGCYLETLKPENVGMYEHFSFRLKEKVKIKSGNLTLFALHRPKSE